MASKYQRNGIWYVKWYLNGVRQRQSTFSIAEVDADRLIELVERQKQDAKQRGIGLPPKGKIYFSELLDDMDDDYAINDRRSSRDLFYRGEKIRQFCGGMEVYPTATITASTILLFRDLLHREGKANGTINRYLAILSRAFTLGLEHEKVTTVPYVKRLKEAAPRTNWWNDEQIGNFLSCAPIYLRRIVVFAAFVSWRRGDILCIRREWLDRGVLNIPPGQTKGGEARQVVIPDAIHWVVEGTGEYLFHRGDGHQIKSIRTAWDLTMKRAGLVGSGLTFHALRRTARRFIERVGISDRVGMSMMGHKTRWVYDNYRIVPAEDLAEAAEKQNQSAPQWATHRNEVDTKK